MTREYEAYLAARDLSEALLMASGDKMRGVRSDYYMREARRTLRELSVKMQVLESAQTEASQ